MRYRQQANRTFYRISAGFAAVLLLDAIARIDADEPGFLGPVEDALQSGVDNVAARFIISVGRFQYAVQRKAGPFGPPGRQPQGLHGVGHNVVPVGLHGQDLRLVVVGVSYPYVINIHAGGRGVNKKNSITCFLCSQSGHNCATVPGCATGVPGDRVANWL